MRRLRTLSITLFIASLILFGINYYKRSVYGDKTGPVFQIEDNLVQVSVKDDEKALLKGLTATDAADGDVTDSVIVESVSPFTGTGRRIVNYAAFDSDGHISRALRTMSYTDYTSPVITLTGPLSFPVGTVNLLQGVSAQDCIDGDISDEIELLYDEEMNPSVPGIYPARLRVRNSIGGYAELPVSIELYSTAERSSSVSGEPAAAGTDRQDVVVTEGGAQ